MNEDEAMYRPISADNIRMNLCHSLIQIKEWQSRKQIFSVYLLNT